MNDLSIFKYESKEVRTVDIDGETYWVAKDVCEVLDIKNATQAVAQLDQDELTMFYIGGQVGEVNVINESGLYSLIIRSNKPEAKRFKKWITSEVLPSIRKTGQYLLERKIEELQSQYAELEESISEDHKTLKSVMEFAGKIITMQEDTRNKKILGEKLFNSRKFNITVSSPNKED